MTRFLVLALIPGLMLVIARTCRKLRRERAAKQLAHADSLIKKPVVRYAGTDNTLRERTEKRRRAADGIRQRAARVDSGAPVSDVLRMVK